MVRWANLRSAMSFISRVSPNTIVARVYRGPVLFLVFVSFWNVLVKK